MEIDIRYMKRALSLARFGMGHVSPNPMVGCVIESGGKIIGEGWHRQYGSAHAEVNAISSVSDTSLLHDSTLYVTLEPCAHFGKTPPCADMIVKCGIPRVVVGITDPFAKVDGAGIRKMREAGIEVVTGILEDECRKLNRRFFTAHTLHRPYIILKWAQDKAGIMGDSSGRRLIFSTPLSQAYVHELRAGCDAIITGSGTVIADNPSLDNRLWPGNSPRAVILDRRRTIPGNAKILQRESTLLISEKTPLKQILEKLYSAYSISSVLVEAGPELLNSFIKESLWDECRIETSSQFSEGDIKAPRVPENAMLESVEIVGRNLIETFVCKR